MIDRDADFARRVVIVIALGAATLLISALRSILLLLFTAILVAVLLTSVEARLRRVLPVGRMVSITLSIGLIVAVIALAGWLFGSAITRQFDLLVVSLPSAWTRLQAELRGWGVLDQGTVEARNSVPSAGAVLGFVGGLASGAVGVISGVGLAVVGGIYFALDPDPYARGLRTLWPRNQRKRIGEAMDAIGRALKGFLKAQLAAMAIIGSLTTLGLWAIGSPSFLALGLIAGVVQFVPLLGPFIAAVPALLLALTEGPHMLVYTALLYVAIQQAEGNLITPMVQREVAAIPPALTIFTVVAFGTLFGIVGIVLAVPLTVVVYALVGKIWVRDALGEELILPGERHDHKGFTQHVVGDDGAGPI